MSAASTTASTVPSTAATASAAEAASLPAAAASATAKTASIPATTADGKQEVKSTLKLGSSLTTNGKYKGSILKFNFQHFQNLFFELFFSQSAANRYVQGSKKCHPIVLDK